MTGTKKVHADLRICAELVVAGLIMNEDREVLLVEWNSYWSVPTEHVQPEDETPEDALRRGMKEELGLDNLEIVKPLGSIIRNRGSPNPKSIEIFFCKALEKEIKFYREPRGDKRIWIRLSQAQEMFDLDVLAKEAIERLKSQSLKRENGGSTNERGGDFTIDCRSSNV